MKKNAIELLCSVVLVGGAVFACAAAFAQDDNGRIVPGVTDPCQQLWLVNGQDNALKEANSGGICVDVPVSPEKLHVVFNLDNALTDTGAPDGVSIGLRHMVMLGNAMKYRISQGLIEAKDVSIVGIMHGTAMTAGGWAFKQFKGAPNSQAGLLEQLFQLNKDGVNIQLEACGVTIRGMQDKGALMPNGQPLDERAVYVSPNGLGRIYVNQGAVGRIIDLQQHNYVYFQED